MIFVRPRRNFTELNSNAISVTKIGQLPTQIGTKLAEGWQLFLKHYEKMIEVRDEKMLPCCGRTGAKVSRSDAKGAKERKFGRPRQEFSNE